VAGVAVSLVVTPWLAYDHVAGSLFIFCVTTLGTLGFMLSPHAYAWLFATITVNLIVLSSLQNPLLAVPAAFYRVYEVIIGSGIALLVALALAPEGVGTAPAPRGWSGIWDRNWPHLLHAMRAGLTVMLLPWVWSWLVLPSPSQMSITVVAIMAVPTLAADPMEGGRRVASQSLQRNIRLSSGRPCRPWPIVAIADRFCAVDPGPLRCDLGLLLFAEQRARAELYRHPSWACPDHDLGPGLGSARQYLAGDRPFRRDDRRSRHTDVGLPSHLA
jgi:Predicted membrane protein